MLVAEEASSANLPFDWLIHSLGGPFPFLTPGPLDAITNCRGVCSRPKRDRELKRNATHHDGAY